jgi:hypothetical protein
VAAAGWGTDVDSVEAVIPVLTRHILDVMDEVMGAIRESEQPERRGVLYEALEGVLVVGDAAAREQLRQFALERWEVEKAGPDPENLAYYPLHYLAHLGDPLFRERLGEIHRILQGLTIPEFDDLLEVLDGGDVLDHVRRRLSGTWRDTARQLER